MSLISFIVDLDLKQKIRETIDDHVFIYIDIHELIETNSITISKSIRQGSITSAFVAGLILSEDKSELEEAILKHCQKLFPHFTENLVFKLSPNSDLSAWITRATVSFSQLIAMQAIRTEQENTEIRILYEKAQSALFEIERTQKSSYTPKIVLQITPGKRADEISASSIQLRINRDYPALHAIDLFFDKRPYVVSSANIIVEMNGAMSGRHLASWRIPEERLLEGWNRFYCPVVDEPPGENVTISVRATSVKPQFMLRAGAHVEGLRDVSILPEDQQPIALRLWSGLLGLKLPQLQPGHFVEGEEHTNPSAVSRAELLQLGSSADREDTQLVAWEEARGGLIVHPRGTTPVIARIPMLQVVNLSEIRVTCKLAHPQAPATDFGAWIVRTGEKISVKSPALQEEHRKSRFFGSRRNLERGRSLAVPSNVNWLTLLSEQEGEISFTVDPAYTGACDLFMATRNHTNINHYAWAVFTDVRFELSQY